MPAGRSWGMTITDYGATTQGQKIRQAALGLPGGLQVTLIEYGARLTAIRVPHRGGLANVLLGHDTLADYEADATYQGAIVGRFANRIGGAAFAIDGESFPVTANEGGNCLHGGRLGLSKRAWTFDEARTNDTQAVLAYHSPNGEEGFPGAVEMTVTFTVAPDGLTIDYAATVDAATPLNLCHHPYFNLSGNPQLTILGHELAIDADAITPVGAGLIPTGKVRPVAGTPFDLRQPQRIGDAIALADPQLDISRGLGTYNGFDHNWVLRPGAAPAVRVRSPESGLQLEIETTQPGLQVYTSQLLDAPRFVRYGGLVLEPQNFPNAPNQPAFPDSIVRPGSPYWQRTTYRFSACGSL